MCDFLDLLDTERIEYKSNVALSSISSFRVGGVADVVAYPDSEAKLITLIDRLTKKGIAYRIFGNTSNVLFSDSGYRGVIIITKKISDIEFSNTRVNCGCGVMLSTLAERAAKLSLSGLEFACGIPGSIGGAVFMNAGAHGGSMSDILISSRAYDVKRGEIIEINIADHDFSYRHSIYSDRNDLVCLSATLSLCADTEENIRAVMRANQEKRRSTQPLNYPSAGSFFKRPNGHFAAKLIDDCGLKGLRVGGACVSEKHAGFIVNLGSATSKEILTLSDIVVERVKEMTGITLEREVIFVE